MAKKNIAGFIRAKTLEMRDRVANKPDYREVWSFRGFWYWMKPFLMAYEEMTVEEKGWSRKRSQQVSSVVSDMVLEGAITYKSILVEDQDRVMNIAVYPNYYKDVVIFVEKNNVYHMVKSVADLFDVTIVAGKGFAATSSIEKLIDGLDNGRKYKVFLLTDYDPFGAYIGQEFCSRCETLGLEVEVIRAGLSIDQIPTEHRDTSKYPVSKGNLPDEFFDAWVEKNPMDNWGFELECFTAFMEQDAAHIRTILVECLLQHCPETIMYDKILKQTIEGLEDNITHRFVKTLDYYVALKKQIDELTEKLEKFEEEAINIVLPIAEEELEKIPDNRSIPSGSLRRQAIDGSTWLRHDIHTNTYDIGEKLFNRLEELNEDGDIDLDDITPE